MIDRDQVLVAFQEYTDHFDSNNLQIANKKRHTLYVAANSENIARNLSLAEDDVELAWMIGILHDIGRFEQVRQTNGYTDTKALDHAELGVKILFKHKLFKQFVYDETDTINKAVCYHNKLDLPASLKPRELLFCNIIRDADKADIFRGFLQNDFYSFHEHTPEEVQESDISEAIMNCFQEHRTIPLKLVKSAADFFLMSYALYFGLVYGCSRQLVEGQGYYAQMLDFKFDRKENQEKFLKIKQYIAEYISGQNENTVQDSFHR